MNVYAYICAFVLLLIVTKGNAQKLFTEGKITYTVTIDPPANDEGIVQYSGTYTILLKDKRMRKDLKLENGYENSMLYVDNNMYSLKKMGKKNFAIQLDMHELQRKNEQYNNFAFAELMEKEKIAGIDAQKAIIKYKDNTTTDILYTREWQVPSMVFERFPEIKVLPLLFHIVTEEGVILHFRVKSVDTGLVENSNFKIPADYKIISSEEYKTLR